MVQIRYIVLLKLITNIHLIIIKELTNNNLKQYILLFEEIKDDREFGHDYVSVVETFASKEDLDLFLYELYLGGETDPELLFSNDYLELYKYDEI